MEMPADGGTKNLYTIEWYGQGNPNVEVHCRQASGEREESGGSLTGSPPLGPRSRVPRPDDDGNGRGMGRRGMWWWADDFDGGAIGRRWRGNGEERGIW